MDQSPPEGIVVGDDGRPRCSWGVSTADYVAYHDEEWGRPVADEIKIFEKLCLEGFQSGLSWITILRKRPGFRQAFAGFDPVKVAAFGPAEIDLLLGNAGIVRHRGKIEATIRNARALVDLHDKGRTLAGLIWSHRPISEPALSRLADIQASTPESTALSKQLRKLGFAFVGPTTVYAAMQSLGVVNDHLVGCDWRGICDEERRRFSAPTVG